MPCTHVHTDDLRGSLTLLTAALTVTAGRPGRARARRGAARPSCSRRRIDGPGMRYRDAMTVLDAALPDGVDIVVDAGNIGASAIHYLPVRRDGRFIVALGMGGMGYSFGAGIGDGVRDGGRRTVVIAGDGSFFMHGMEIHTARAVPAAGHVPAVRQPRARDVRDPRAAVLRRSATATTDSGPAGSVPGWPRCSPACRRSTSTTSTSCPPRLRAALDVDGPSVVSIECSADEIPPFAPFLGKAAAEATVITEENTPMSLPALDDITAHRGTADPIDGVIRIETSPREKATPIIMEMMRSVYPHDEVFGDVLHRQRLHRLSARRAVRLPGRHPLPGGVDLQPAWFHPHRGARAVGGLRPAGGSGRPRSSPAPSPTARRAPSTTTARGTRASTCG